MIVFNQ